MWLLQSNEFDTILMNERVSNNDTYWSLIINNVINFFTNKKSHMMCDVISD